MWRAGTHASIYFHQVMLAPHLDIRRNGLEFLGAARPGSNSHPVLLAKYILLIATVLQYINPESYEMIETMSEPPRAMANRLVTTAANLVTAHDELLGSLEGLECIMMEGMYQANCGNLRRAWVSFRPQLIGIHRTGTHKLKALVPKARSNTPYLWYRIVCTDRFLSLMLGLPQGSPDRSMTSEPAFAGDTEVDRLERLHCVIASRILERNDANPESCSFDITLQIDADLQKVAETMSSGWWLVPNLEAAAASCDDQIAFWEMLRLVSQLLHFNLLNQLHLPFMLRCTSTESRNDHYSQMTCVNASREVLLRFNAFRSFNRVPYCCRAIDFFALVAALTLLAHLDSHRRGHINKGLNFLAHQRPGDRGMMEVVLDHMDQICELSTDALSAQSASLLRRLLAIEAEAATGSAYATHRVCVLEGQSPSQIPIYFDFQFHTLEQSASHARELYLKNRRVTRHSRDFLFTGLLKLNMT